MLHATGMSLDDMTKPQVGISSVWWEGNPCNDHLLGLAQKVKEGCILEDMIGFIHSTVGVSDGMTQGNAGMSYSLPSRDLIADSIELINTAQSYDANIQIPGMIVLASSFHSLRLLSFFLLLFLSFFLPIRG